MRLLAHHDDAGATRALAGTVEVDEEHARQAVGLELAVAHLELHARTDQRGAQVRVAVPEQGAVAARQVRVGVGPRLNLFEVLETRVAERGPVVLLGEDGLEAVAQVGLQEGVARGRVVVVELLDEERAGGVTGVGG